MKAMRKKIWRCAIGVCAILVIVMIAPQGAMATRISQDMRQACESDPQLSGVDKARVCEVATSPINDYVSEMYRHCHMRCRDRFAWDASTFGWEYKCQAVCNRLYK